ncbi:hypothetical protein ES708_27243 [subsurface metagenome]
MDHLAWRKPTITISASGAYAGYIWLHNYPIWASDCNVIHAKNASIEYYYFTLKLKQYQIYALQSGGAQPHVYAKDLKKLKVNLPPISLQKRIVEMLNTAQQELNIFKQLSIKYKEQKRGLMQKLLTGEWHVRPEVVERFGKKVKILEVRNEHDRFLPKKYRTET